MSVELGGSDQLGLNARDVKSFAKAKFVSSSVFKLATLRVLNIYSVGRHTTNG